MDPPTWKNLLALAKHYKARLMVGSFTYNQRGIGANNQKRHRGRRDVDDSSPWWDERVVPYIADSRERIAPGLSWCGELQILPTAVRPLSAMDGYTGRDSSIFPPPEGGDAERREREERAHEVHVHDRYGDPTELHPAEGRAEGGVPP